MKRKIKKTLALTLAVSVLAGMCACTKKEEQTVSDVKQGEIPKTLSVFAPLGAYSIKNGATNNNETLPFQLMEELTGCHVEWDHPAADAYTEKFNLMIASGKYPDVVIHSWLGIQGGAKTYADDGVIIPLGNLIDDNMPYLSAFNKENPNVKKQYMDNEGEIYAIPFIRKDKELKIFAGPQIREDWLKKLGLQVPQTPEALYEVLKAFKTQDPNGNGEADEIPMSGVGFDHQEHGIGNLLWGFGTHYDFYIKDNKVKYGILEEEFEEGIAYITKLYQEDLIDMDYLLNDRDKMDNKVLNNKVGFIYSLQPGKFYTSMKDSERKMIGVPHVAVEEGINNVYNASYIMDVKDTSAAITTTNPNPSGTLKWLDHFYGGEGLNYMNFGQEGLTYDWVDEYPKLSDYILNNPDGKTLQEMGGQCLGTYQSHFPAMQDWRYYEQILTEWGKDSIKTWSDSANTEGILPSLAFTSDETKKITQVMSQVETYVSEAINQIVLGRMKVEELGTVRNKIRKMGIDDVLKIYNDAYQRYVAR